jgi:hypothetical protein
MVVTLLKSWKRCMNNSIGICTKCNKKTVVVNKRHGLCNTCNKARLSAQKDRYGGNNTDNDDNNEHKGKQSQISLFKKVWDESNKKCQLTGKDLSWIVPYTSHWFSCFAHILPKGKYPRFKYLQKNILLVHYDIHYQLDMGTVDSVLRTIGQEGYDKWLLLRENLLAEYNSLR